MRWVRGGAIGRGSFATVSLAVSGAGEDRFPPLMAVKSCGVDESATLQNERQVLSRLGDCPEVIRCYGADYSCEGGRKLYNVLLEYAAGGCLANRVRDFGALAESDVRRYTRSILKGLDYIHGAGFVHCDVKLQNLLLCSSSSDSVFCAKIGDFGLARKVENVAGRKGLGLGFRGTPLYMAPECLSGEEHTAAADIWALGCAVVEMASGKSAWKWQPGTDGNAMLFRIWNGKESPEVPSELSEEGKDFIQKCFLRDPTKRWTAEMLLNHPFVAGTDVTVPLKQFAGGASTSPRDPFDFPEWASDQTPSPRPDTETGFDSGINSWIDSSSRSSAFPEERIRQLASKQNLDWSVSESWISVR